MKTWEVKLVSGNIQVIWQNITADDMVLKDNDQILFYKERRIIAIFPKETVVIEKEEK
jgi:hypothetical protein